MTKNQPILAKDTFVRTGVLWNAINGCYDDGDNTRNDLLHGTEPLLLELTANTLSAGTNMCLLQRAGIAIARLTLDEAGTRPLHLYARPDWSPPSQTNPHTVPLLFEDRRLEGPVWLSRIHYTPGTIEELRRNPDLNYDELDRILEVWREEITRGLKALAS